ncbi:MAG: O-antigen ligase family protein [Microvirga sp.]|nr:O-antigen ligase family protein [Microvirga sp.]
MLLLALACVAYMGASLVWTPDPGRDRAVSHLFHIIGALLIAATLLRLGRPTQFDSTWPIIAGLSTACLLVLAHFQFDGAINAAMGAATEPFRLNRAAVAIALLSPLALALAWRRGLRLAPALLAALAVAAVSVTESETAKLAALLMAAAWPIARWRPRAFHAFAATAMVANLALTPLYIGHVNDLIPTAVHEAVGYGVLTIRGEIWREYATLLALRPVLGFGLEASHVIAASPLVEALPEARRALLDYGHPHNAALQVWFELGAAGALLLCALMAAVFRAMAKLPAPDLALATMISLGIYAVALVSHGAWQAWWLCLIALIAMQFKASVSVSPLDTVAH